MFRILTSHSFFNIARAFIGAVLVVYLLDNQITLATIALAKALQLFTSVLANYPAGKIADRFGKKTAILTACFCTLIYFLLMLKPTPFTVLLGEIFNGLSIAFYMGAYEAWVFEFKNNKENSFTLISRSAELFFLSAIINYYFTPQRRNISLDHIKHHKPTFLSDIHYFLKKQDTTLLFYIIFAGSMQLIYQYWIVFFSRNLNIENQYLGYILSLMLGGQWLFSYIARKLDFNHSKYAIEISLISLSFFSILTLFLFLNLENNYLFSHLFIIVSFILFVSFSGLTSNLFFAKSCDKFAHSNNESSMISLIDMSSRMIGTIMLAFVSLLNTDQTPFIWLIFTGIIFIYFIANRIKYYFRPYK